DTDLTVQTGNDYENSRLLFQAGFNYLQTFGDHQYHGMLMYQQDQYTVLGNQSPFAMQALLGRFNYNFQQKYYLEAAFSYYGLETSLPAIALGSFPRLLPDCLYLKRRFWIRTAWWD